MAQDQDDPFKDPGSGYGPKAEELVGKLLLVSPKKHREGIKTKFGEKDSMDGTLVILDEKDVEKSEETSFSFMGGRLIGALKDARDKGAMVLGRMGTEPTDKGNPAYVLAKATDAEKKVARAYLAQVKDPFDT